MKTEQIFLALIVVAGLGCRDKTAPVEFTQNFLNEPSVFLPTGLLRSPQGIAVDASANVWVADTRNGKLRRFSSAGIQTDSILYPDQVQRVAIDKQNGNLLIIHNTRVVDRMVLPGKTVVASYPLSPFTGDATLVFDTNTRITKSIAIGVTRLGDIDSSPIGDIYVSGQGSPENFVIKISNTNVSVIASSSLVPTNAAEAGPRFLAVDAFGTVFTSFTFIFAASQNIVRMYSVNPASITQSKILEEPLPSGAARGGTIDASGNVYIADPLTQELIIVSSTSEKTITAYRIPDTDGLSMSPQDVAVAADGTVYVVVIDRSGTEAGAILKYTRSAR